MKKTVSLILALLLVLGTVGIVSAYAAGPVYDFETMEKLFTVTAEDIVYDGDPYDGAISVKRTSDDEEVKAGTYELLFYESGSDITVDEPLDGAPSEIGAYMVVAAKESKNRYGVGYFAIKPEVDYDSLEELFDVSAADMEYDGEAYDGAISVTRKSDDEEVKAGTYDIYFYEAGSDITTDAPIDAPVLVGDYMVVAVKENKNRYGIGTFSITPRVIEWSWNGTDPVEFEYDGESHIRMGKITNKATRDGEVDDVRAIIGDRKTDAGEYTAQVTGLYGDDKDNYKLPDTMVYEGEFTITPIHLGLAWTNTDLTYNGEDQAPTAILSGVTGTDVVEVTVEGAEKDANAEGETYTAYALISETNYTLDGIDNSVDYTISPLKVELEWTNTDLEYDGTEQAPEAIVTNAFDGDEVNVTVEKAQKNAGEYLATATELDNPNYTLEGVENIETDFVISPLKVIVKWSKQTEFEYDGEEHGLTCWMGNKVNGDNVWLKQPEKQTNKGEYTVEAGPLTGEDAGNYTLEGVENLENTFVINPRKVIVKWSSQTDFVYNGEEQGMTCWMENKVEGDRVWLKQPEKQINKGEYTAVAGPLTGADADNYTLDDVENLEVEWKIDPRVVEVKWAKIDEFPYDGEEHIRNVWMTNKVDGDRVWLQTGDKQTDAGEYDATITGLTGADAGNYTLEGMEDQTMPFSISKRIVEVKWAKIDEFPYDGEEHIRNVWMTNKVDGDRVWIQTGDKQTDAGEYDATIYGLTGADAGNYTLEGMEDQTMPFSISKRIVELEWTNTDFTYDGEEHIPTCTVTNPVTGEEVNVIVIATETDAGEYVATATDVDDANYTIEGAENLTQDWVINKRIVELEWTDTEFDYNGEEHIPTCTVTNPVTGEEVNVTVEKSEIHAGEYVATATDLDDDNYTLEGAEGLTQDWVINKRVVTIKWSGLEYTYDGEEHIPNAWVSNKVDGDKVGPIIEQAEIHAGEYEAVITGLKNKAKDDYTIEGAENLTQAWVINKRVVELEWTNTDLTYNAQEQIPVCTVKNLATDSDVVEVTVEKAEKDAGEYVATATDLSNSDYTLESATDLTTDWEIKPFVVALEWTNTDLVYNGTEQIPEAKVTNAFDGDEVNVTVEKAEKDAGEYLATATELDNPNYTLEGCEETEQEWTIAQLVAKLFWDDTFFVYDGQEHLPVAIVENACEGDDVTVTVIETQTDAGEYVATATDISDSNYTLEGCEEIEQNWEIGRRKALVVPFAGQQKRIGFPDGILMYKVLEVEGYPESGLVEGERLEGRLLREPGEREGMYKYIFTELIENNPNYDLEFDTDERFEIVDLVDARVIHVSVGSGEAAGESEEENPNTGAPNLSIVPVAVVSLAAVLVGKKH